MCLHDKERWEAPPRVVCQGALFQGLSLVVSRCGPTVGASWSMYAWTAAITAASV